MKQKKGFTLTELLLSVALIGMISAFIFPVYLNFQTKNNLSLGTDSVVQTIRRSQILAQASINDSDWGVKITNDKVIIFSGQNYANRDEAYDEEVDIPKSITPSGLDEIVFKKLSGETTNTGNIILTSVNNEENTININEQGRLEY